MKKVTMLLGAMLVSASAFALNAEVSNDDLCRPGREAFEASVASLTDDVEMTQKVLGLADSLEKIADDEALPIAACYATYKVNGQSVVDFARTQEKLERSVNSKRLATFANRVEMLSKKADFLQVAARANTGVVVQHMMITLADPFAKMDGAEAVRWAKSYATYTIKGKSLVEFAREQANSYEPNLKRDMQAFADRVERLSK